MQQYVWSKVRSRGRVCVLLFFMRDGELPEEHLEQSMNLINFPQKSNHHVRQICEK